MTASWVDPDAVNRGSLADPASTDVMLSEPELGLSPSGFPRRPREAGVPVGE